MDQRAVDLRAIFGLAEFEAAAQDQLEPAHFDYIAGGSGDELTLSSNSSAWQRWRLRPRVLVDVSRVDTSVTVLGGHLPLPVGMAPVAFQHLAHQEAELPGARSCARQGLLYCLSTMSSRSLEEVAEVAGQAGQGPRWFQLYVHQERSRSAELVSRAEAAGYQALVLTADFPVAGTRLRDLRNSLPYPQVYGNFELPAAPTGSLPLVIGGLNDPSLSWKDLAWLRGLSRLPLVVKGILTGADARLAVEHGAAGVWVSNHGGRQLDRTPATADVLAEVVDAVAGRAEVYVDSGLRRGVDILTALAIGARAVFIGRPFVFAAALGGELGITRAVELLQHELNADMALLGVTRLDQLNRDFILRG